MSAQPKIPDGLWIERNDSVSAVTPLPRPEWLPHSVWPFETSAVEVEGARLAVTDVGQGPVLLFVHTGFWSMIWREVILRLTPDVRCVCFDAPGTGLSDRLPVKMISLEKASRALVTLVQALDLRDITLVVHDLGGPSGITGAACVAERIRAICAVNAFAWRPRGTLFRGMLALMGNPLMRELSAWTGILARVTATSFGTGHSLAGPSRDAFLAGIGRQGLRTFHSYLSDARRADRLYAQLDGALAGVFSRLPFASVFGEKNDPLGFQPRWKQLFPRAHQFVVAKGNHFPMCDDPDLVARAIRELHANATASS